MLNCSSTYKCEQLKCPLLFSNWKSLSYHLRTQHNDLESTTSMSTTITNETVSLTNYNSHSNLNQTQPSDGAKEHIESIDEIKSIISKNALKFVTKLNSISYTNNLHIEKLLKEFSENLSFVFLNIKKVVLPEISNVAKRNEIGTLLDCCSNPFSNINTEYKLVKSLVSKNLMVIPEQIILKKEVGEIMKKGIPQMSEVTSTGTIMPIEFQIKSFFSMSGTLNSTLKYIQDKKKEKENISNFVQGKLWKSKNIPEKTIPFFLYYDDFEVNDPIGNHTGTQSIGAFYYSFPVLPPDISSKLDSIFPAMFILTKNLKTIGPNICLSQLMKVFNKLETVGVEIKTDNSTERIFFSLGLIIGDNKALNEIMLFSKSFSHNFFCRFCVTEKKQTYDMVTEDPNSLRDRSNYNVQLSTDNYKETGIQSNSILNSLPTFHVTENYSVDVMHDAFEGIIKFGIMNSLLYFVENKVFTLETFNYRFRNFSYGEIEIRNRCEEIKKDHLKKKTLHLSARESYNMLHFFTFFVGDFVNTNHIVWKYIISLENLVNFMLLPSYTKDDLKKLKCLISNHHEQYVQVFSTNLRPKHHIITHYPTIITFSGPVRYLSCMRFESKNREIKNYTNVCASRRNLPLTIGKKMSIKFSNLLINEKTKTNTYLLEKIVNKEYFIEAKLHFSENDLKEIKCTHFIEYNGTCYKTDYLVFSKHRLFKIVEFLFLHEQIFLVLNELKINKDAHYNAFLIQEKYTKYHFKKISDFEMKPFLSNVIANGDEYCKIRYL